MGLDVYVGTLTRYYAREWETVVQRYAREEGLTINLIRAHEPSDAVTNPVQLEAIITAWLEGLNGALAAHLTAPLGWLEGMMPPYFTDKPAWNCYSALLVWAAHEEQADPRLPPVAPADWTADAAVRRSQTEGFKSRYGQLLYGPELWLPGEFRFTFRTVDATGHEVQMGSVHELRAQLEELNRRTWRADGATIEQWRRDGAELGAPFETSARFGFAVFWELAGAAIEHGLPMKLDY